MQAQTLEEAILHLDPRLPLAGDSPFYVPRHGESLAGLVRLFRQNPDKYVKILFTGHRGSGKTTELNRLAEQLGEHFFVLDFDVEGKLDPRSLTYVEVLLYMGVSAYFAAREANLKLSEGLLEKLYQSLYTLFHTIVEVDEKKVTVIGRLEALIAKLEGLLKIGATGEITRKVEIEPKAYELLDALNRILEEIQRLARQEVVVLVDGLDKVSYEVGKALYERSTILVQPHCKVVYTIPLALAFSTEFPQIRRFFDGRRTLPNVKVWHRDDTPDDEGRAFLGKVIHRRVAEHLITTEGLKLSIEGSGGVLRDLIEFAQNACDKALSREGQQIEQEDVRRTLNDFRRDYHRTLRPQHYEALRKVQASRDIADAGDLADELIYNLTVLEYANDDDWYNVHPLVAELLEKRYERV